MRGPGPTSSFQKHRHCSLVEPSPEKLSKNGTGKRDRLKKSKTQYQLAMLTFSIGFKSLKMDPTSWGAASPLLGSTLLESRGYLCGFKPAHIITQASNLCTGPSEHIDAVDHVDDPVSCPAMFGCDGKIPLGWRQCGHDKQCRKQVSQSIDLCLHESARYGVAVAGHPR